VGKKTSDNPEADTITHIGQLTQQVRNARKHTPRNIGMIANALQEVGASRSIVIDETGEILAGNGTFEAAAQAGIEKVMVVDADGDTIVAVRRKGLSPIQKVRLALYDNRSAELATWDTAELAALEDEKPEIMEGIFYHSELDAIFEKAAAELSTLDGAFSPNVSPVSAHRDVTRADMEKAADQLGNVWVPEEMLPIVCPHCAGEFYLKRKDWMDNYDVKGSAGPS
jgi:hypothetical protein